MAFDGQVEEMTNAYLHWYSSLGDTRLSNDNPVPSLLEFQDEYPVEVFDMFGIQHLDSNFLLSY